MSPLFIVVLYGKTNAKSCKPVLESADENVYLSEKKRNIRFKEFFFSKLNYLEKYLGLLL
jgi:hypothetical protein